MADIIHFLKDSAQEGLFPYATQMEAARRFSMTFAQIEEIALQNFLLPARYQRNREIITVNQQLTLFRSR